jgi:hypothetical protein
MENTNALQDNAGYKIQMMALEDETKACKIAAVKQGQRRISRNRDSMQESSGEEGGTEGTEVGRHQASKRERHKQISRKTDVYAEAAVDVEKRIVQDKSRELQWQRRCER